MEDIVDDIPGGFLDDVLLQDQQTILRVDTRGDTVPATPVSTEPNIARGSTANMREVYKQGFLDGLKAYAYMKDGEYFVGTTGRSLKAAIDLVESTHNFNPPE